MSAPDHIILADGARMAFRVYDFTDPWLPASTIMLIHGNSESGIAWNRWVPALSKSHRLVLPDLRGFGDSDPMPESYRWTLEALSADLVYFLDRQKIDRVHVIGTKIGGTLAMDLAARHRTRVTSLTVLGSPTSGQEILANGSPVDLIRKEGVKVWAGRSMAARLGTTLPPAAHSWWADYMGQTASSTQLGFMRDLINFDVRNSLKDIACPTLVVTPREGTPLGSVDEIALWQKAIPRSKLLLVDSDGYHVSVTAAGSLIPSVAAFIASHDAEQQ